MIQFRIPGEPRGKGRPRFTRNGRPYTDDRTRFYEHLVQQAYQNTGAGMMDKPVRVMITAFHGVPVSWKKAKREAAERNLIAPTCKPDVDNVAKIILDALNGLAWRDDTLVSCLHVKKLFTAEQPFVVVRISAEFPEPPKEDENAHQ